MKKTLLTLLAIVIAFCSNAAEVTFDFTKDAYGLPNNSNDYVTSPSTITQSPVSIVLTSDNNGFRMWTDGLRVYKSKNTKLTVSAGGASITNITWNAASGISFTTTGSTDNITSWEGNSTSVELTCSTTSTNAIKTITITFEGDVTVDPDPVDPTPGEDENLQTTINTNAFNYKQTAYALNTFNDTEYGVIYQAVFSASGNNLQFNTKNDNGKGSALAVTSISDDYTISSIKIEASDLTKLNVYSYDTAMPEPVVGTAYSTPEDAVAVTGDAGIYEINNKAFAIVPNTTGAITFTATVYYQKNGDTSAIADIAADEAEAPAEYFNLQGQRVANPAAGALYIVRQGSKVSKVIL